MAILACSFFGATVRQELNDTEGDLQTRPAPSFEPGDPARVPGQKLAWGSAAAAAALVIAGLLFWRSYYAPAGSPPSLLPEGKPTPGATAAPPPIAAAASGGQVVFTALEQGIWVKFYDGNGTQLMQKQMARGESYTVPGAITGVKIWTARPNALAITVGGKPVPKLSEVQKTVKDIPVTAAALLARPAASSAVRPSHAQDPLSARVVRSPDRHDGTAPQPLRQDPVPPADPPLGSAPVNPASPAPLPT